MDSEQLEREPSPTPANGNQIKPKRRVASIMTALDKIKETAEQQREEAKNAWHESLRVILSDGSESIPLLISQAESLRLVYVLAMSRVEGMALMWAAASEIYEITRVEEP